MTQAATRQKAAAISKSSVMKLLNWDEQQYADFQYATGLTFLEQYLPNDEFARRQLEEHSFFWAWWRNMWLMRDETFIAHAHDMLWADRRDEYLKLHDPVMLADENTEMGRFVDSSYCVMARNLSRTVQK